MANLPRQLTRKVKSYLGQEFTGHAKDLTPMHRGYWCESCETYNVWPGADWGASHYFCDDCLSMHELGQGLVEDKQFRHEWAVMLKADRSSRALHEGQYARNLYISSQVE